jgi:tetraacyldisaccharide 4'-kinase
MKNPDKRWEKIIWTEKGGAGILGEVIRSPLFFLSVLYLAVVKIRLFLYQSNIIKSERVETKVIVVGNLSVGGTGKTPVASWIAGKLADLGHSPCVIFRGYKGSNDDETLIVSDGKQIFAGPQKAGDEAVIIAQELLEKNVPVIADRKRVRAAKKAVDGFGATHIILDDGFQHLALQRDMDILVVDSNHDPGKMYLLPRGPLREPVTAAQRASAIIVSRSETSEKPGWSWLDDLTVDFPVFNMKYKVTGIKSSDKSEDENDNAAALAFCGIGDPDNFFDTLKKLGLLVVDKIAFPDHHNYTESEVKNLIETCKNAGGKRLLTTKKDAVKIESFWLSEYSLDTVEVKADFMGRDEEFIQLVLNSVDTDGRT